MSKDDRELIERTPAQFFFEVGFAAAYAQALIANDMKPPFTLTDAIVEHAWEIAGEAHDDPEEFDRYLSATRLEALQAQPVGETAIVWAREVTARYFENDPLDKGRKEIAQHTREGRYDDQDAVQIALHTRAALTASPPVVEREAIGDVAATILRDVCELDGYTSPDDQPDLLQCTTDELDLIVRRALGEDA